MLENIEQITLLADGEFAGLPVKRGDVVAVSEEARDQAWALITSGRAANGQLLIDSPVAANAAAPVIAAGPAKAADPAEPASVQAEAKA